MPFGLIASHHKTLNVCLVLRRRSESRCIECLANSCFGLVPKPIGENPSGYCEKQLTYATPHEYTAKLDAREPQGDQIELQNNIEDTVSDAIENSSGQEPLSWG